MTTFVQDVTRLANKLSRLADGSLRGKGSPIITGPTPASLAAVKVIEIIIRYVRPAHIDNELANTLTKLLAARKATLMRAG